MSISNLLNPNREAIWKKLTVESINTNDLIVNRDTTGISLDDLDDIQIPFPLKGDLLVYTGLNYAAINLGTPNQILKPNVAFPNGVEWRDENEFKAHATMSFPTNFGAPLQINIITTNVWEMVTGLSQGELLNVTFLSSVLTIELSGVYLLSGGASTRIPGVAGDMLEYGVCVNGADPTPFTSLGGEEDNSVYRGLPFGGMFTLSESDTVQLCARNISANRNMQVASLQFNFVKISN